MIGVFVLAVVTALLADAKEPLEVNDAISTSNIVKAQLRYMIRLIINYLFKLIVMFPVEIIDLHNLHRSTLKRIVIRLLVWLDIIIGG